MSNDAYPDAFLRDILESMKTIAMVGASEKETRPSERSRHGVFQDKNRIAITNLQI
jgi:predicted CoA-binding protein